MSGLPSPFTETRGALAGPESAAEHLRNALQLIDGPIEIVRDGRLLVGEWEERIYAVRRRVAEALALLEPGGVEPRSGSTE